MKDKQKNLTTSLPPKDELQTEGMESNIEMAPFLRSLRVDESDVMKYETLFHEQRISTMQDLKDLTDKDYKELGVVLGVKKKIQKYFLITNPNPNKKIRR